jgi:hypothetical protein
VDKKSEMQPMRGRVKNVKKLRFLMKNHTIYPQQISTICTGIWCLSAQSGTFFTTNSPFRGRFWRVNC